MQKAKALYGEAFPANERVPFFILKKLAKKENCDLFELYSDGFAGMMFTVYYKDIVYIFYLAVDSAMRGKGYGSGSLSAAKKLFTGKRIILSMEEVDKKYNNYEQRLKRQRFYESNGFSVSDYKTSENGVIYEMMHCAGEVKFEEFKSLMESIFGKLIFKAFYKKIKR